MSQTKSQSPPTSPSTAQRGRFAGRRTGNRPPRKPREEAPWIPKTILGKKVASGEITSIEEILSKGLRVQEAGIIKKLLPEKAFLLVLSHDWQTLQKYLFHAY